MGYYRGYTCQCDFSCLLYGECCRDYELLCTSKNSCRGRCGETFKRGRPCSCDVECVKYNQCCPDHNNHCNETDPTPEATEQPLGTPLTLSDDPGAIFIPTVNPTAYQNDEPDSASKQTAEVNDPDPSPLPELSSGFGSTPSELLLEDFTSEPLTPDLDGFEILPEPPTTAASNDETTPSFSTVVPLTTEATASTEADDATISPEPTVFTDVSTEPTPEPTASVTDLQTNEPTQTNEDSTTATAVPTSPPSETLQTTTPPPESSASTHAPSTEVDKTEITTVSPTTADKETTSTPEMTTTINLSTTTPDEVVSEMSTIAAATSTTAAEENTSTDKIPDDTQSTTIAPTTTKPTEKPETQKPFRPILDPLNKPVLNGLGDSTEYPADDNNDMDLCSGRPVGGVTTLSNGTVVVFRGHYFWVLDRNRVPGPAQGITQVWGIPSPIDTVFTRCNCQGKTYIFKGPQYWRYENAVLDPGYPKVIETGFDGLRGHVTAALSVPQHNQRRESVYFFKRGGNVQKYSYQYGTNPTCGRKVHYAIYTHRNRMARQAPYEVLLGPNINYRTSWRGFPTTITAAVSIPNRREPEGYSYYVFSRAKSYKIRIEGERPVVVAAAAKPNTSTQSNEVFKCPKKTSKSH
ncbi:hypothetical protein WMY93_024866 [Mugilogobius chulae]|uniref:SMB domain-containing protein n=1 Tax=Mugilogobius chulae TaxID=88201 RepID=A0AAW0N7L6_9GOBI